MRRILQPIRFVAILSLLLVYVLVMSMVWLFVRQKWDRVRWSHVILLQVVRWGLKILNVKAHYKGLHYLKELNSGALFVGNHLSYLDILVIHAQLPTSFVTSREILETPVLGQVCQLAGCLFVERRNKHNIHNDLSELTRALSEGVNIAIFPEATSTNGEQLLRFRRPLYVAAIDAKKPVVPFCLNYRRVGGQPIDVRNRDQVFWYGDMDFAPHLWALSGSGGVEVELIFLKPILPGPEDDATILAQRSQAEIETVFEPVKS